MHAQEINTSSWLAHWLRVNKAGLRLMMCPDCARLTCNGALIAADPHADCQAFADDENCFASKSVFVEARLRQALASAAALEAPNAFCAAVVCA